MTHFSFNLQFKIKDLLLILLVLAMCSSCSFTNKDINNDNNKTLELAIGSLIKYETNSKISLSYGLNSSLKEVYQTYYSDIVLLPKKERALFFFIVDNNIVVTGGSDLFDYYDLVYSCCKEEYISLIKQNIDNPYFNTDVLQNKLGVIETTGDRIQEATSPYGKSESEHLQELKDFYLSEN